MAETQDTSETHEPEIPPEIAEAIRAAAETPLEPEPGGNPLPALTDEEMQRLGRRLVRELRTVFIGEDGKETEF